MCRFFIHVSICEAIMEMNDLLLLFGMALVAMLYSSVGHGGASGYIALLTLAGFAVLEVRSFVLILNIGVSWLAFYQFTRAGFFRFRFSLPFILGGIPCAFIGGSLPMSTQVLSLLLGIVLLFSAVRLCWTLPSTEKTQEPKWITSLICGAALGFLAGMTGTGGGIFLTPLLILMQWSNPKQAAATSALFIFLNSIAGLMGGLMKGNFEFLGFEFLIAAYLGGMIGSTLGARFLHSKIIQYTLALVLCIAAFKLLRI